MRTAKSYLNEVHRTSMLSNFSYRKIRKLNFYIFETFKDGPFERKSLDLLKQWAVYKASNDSNNIHFY